jgi:hypothetical protein
MMWGSYVRSLRGSCAPQARQDLFVCARLEEGDPVFFRASMNSADTPDVGSTLLGRIENG